MNEIEDQFRDLTNKFEEINFKLDKLSSRVTKIQSDTQLRFSDLESGKITSTQNKQVHLPGSSKPQDFGANPGYQTTNLPQQQTSILLRVQKLSLLKNQKKKSLYYQTNLRRSNMILQ